MRHHVPRRRRSFIVGALMVLALLIPTLAAASTVLNIVPGTAVLLSKSGTGPLSSTSSNTSIFSPAAYVDYKRFGGEPTVTVDRYAFPGLNTSAAAQCGGAVTKCYKDTTYASGPNGFAYPHYSPFFKSDDLGQTFRVPKHVPGQGQTFGTGGGGGDSHSAVGQLTHRVFFVDLPGPGCVTMNTSDDLGETWIGDNLGCGTNPGVIDDRQWVEADETFPGSKNVYVTFINFTNLAFPTLGLSRSTADGSPGTFAGPCDVVSSQIPSATNCPDPADPDLQVAGPIVADNEGTATRPPTHYLYIPFVRGTAVIPGLTSGPPYSLWIAKSTDGGTTWTRNKVAFLGDHNPINLFPQLDVDRGGNIYYTWAQTQGPGQNSSGLLGETDVYYTWSTNGGTTWAAPIDLTQQPGNTAVMPWLVAGDPGLVDIVYYRSNTGLNPNVATVDSNGNACDINNPDDTSCANSNPSVWNVIFGQSNNALTTGGNFNNVQITDHPNHIGQVCTAGLACSGDRDLLDFFTIDVDHLGAANVIWADDNTSRGSDTRNKFSRQLSGSSVYKSTNIGLAKTWPITDHSVTDAAGDVYDSAGLPNDSCAGMDVLGTAVSRSGDLITATMTLNAKPDFAKAAVCGRAPTNGGLWGVEFWAAASGVAAPAENFYIGYRDNPFDGAPRVEGGAMANVNGPITSLEFQPRTAGSPASPGGTCFKLPPPQGTCTITMTVNGASLGIKNGAGMYSITGLSVYLAGVTGSTFPFTRLEPGNSEQADAATAFDDNGTGTTK